MSTNDAMIHFRLEPRSGVPAYRQLYDQVQQAVSLGHLKPGDQLPPVREVVRQITINPNTVHRAYRDLETAGIVEAHPGRGTFVVEVPAPSATPERQAELQNDLFAWIETARVAGMNDDAIAALVSLSIRMKTVAKKTATL